MAKWFDGTGKCADHLIQAPQRPISDNSWNAWPARVNGYLSRVPCEPFYDDPHDPVDPLHRSGMHRHFPRTVVERPGHHRYRYRRHLQPTEPVPRTLRQPSQWLPAPDPCARQRTERCGNDRRRYRFAGFQRGGPLTHHPAGIHREHRHHHGDRPYEPVAARHGAGLGSPGPDRHGRLEHASVRFAVHLGRAYQLADRDVLFERLWIGEQRHVPHSDGVYQRELSPDTEPERLHLQRRYDREQRPAARPAL